MNFGESIRVALQSLRANGLRSFLTLLGVVIGVMTVITVVSFISGLNQLVETKIFNLGPDVFIVSRASQVITSLDEFLEAQKRKMITMEDYGAVSDACTRCKAVGAMFQASGTVKYGREFLTGTPVFAYTEDMMMMRGMELGAGRGITQYDVGHSRPICVLGTGVAETLFPGLDPIGKTLQVADQEFDVVGVGVKQGSALGVSLDNWVAIPISVGLKMFGSRRSIQVYGKARTEEELQEAEDQARLVLRTRRHVPYGARDDFAISGNQTFLDLWASISQAFFAVTIGIASISLVVGGIVVMNIMLVSVTERTREIGVRKALGARRRDIMTQFLIESATLSLLGGLIGIALGAVVVMIVASVFTLPAAIKWWAIALAIVVSTGVGLFFGIYPANKAASLDPIVALRYE
jgi:putative ABC transport system permease protein